MNLKPISFLIFLLLFCVGCTSAPTRTDLCEHGLAQLNSDFEVALQSLTSKTGEGRALASASPDLTPWREWGVERLVRIQTLSDQFEGGGVSSEPALLALTESADDLVLVYSYADLNEPDRMREALIEAASHHKTASEGLCKVTQ